MSETPKKNEAAKTHTGISKLLVLQDRETEKYIGIFSSKQDAKNYLVIYVGIKGEKARNDFESWYNYLLVDDLR